MSDSSKISKLQYLLISQLMEAGEVQLQLPDGVVLEIGIVQEGKHGRTKAENYCSVVASRGGRTAMIDSYNLGVAYRPEENAIVCEGEGLDRAGVLVKTLDIV